MQCAWAILSSVACSALQYFPHYLIDVTIKKKIIEHKMWVLKFPLPLFSEKSFMLLRKEREIINNVYCSSNKVPIIIVRIFKKFNFFHSCSKNPQILNCTKVLPIGTELSHVDTLTSMNLITAFRNSAKAPIKAWQKNTASCVRLRIRSMDSDLYA
jgi:hypothetical protein